jgi:DNA-binding NarL/FixJ family response regulator
VLERAGFRVLTARHSGHALLACLTTIRVDVLLTDLRMEDGTGPDLTERLRRHNPDLRGIYFTDDPAEAAGGDVLRSDARAEELLGAVTRDLPAQEL